jgi:RNA polymerase sigma-70 factor (ECF subfamily)
LIDRELIEECRNGNMSNFRKLIVEVSPFVYSVAFRMTVNDEQAKDILQETLITIWRKLNTLRTPDTFKTWVYKIVINKCYDHLRVNKQKQEITIDEKTWVFLSNHTPEEDPSELENDEMAALINILTEKLSPRQKAVFILSALEEMNNEEISEITGLSRENVKANLYYARKNIGDMIKKIICND